MKISLDPTLVARINKAWNQVTPAQRNAMAPIISRANQQVVALVRTGKAPPAPAEAHHLMFAYSALTGDSDRVVTSLDAGVVVDVGADGVIWGTGKYEQLDPGWLEALAVFLESLLTGKHSFVETSATIPMPDAVQIGMAGDWGTGNWRTAANPAPSTRVGNHLAFLMPNLTIHLGDVYYAGTSHEEQNLLVDIWPQAPLGSLALNSNHEMYPGGNPYFAAIAGSPFGQQQGCSYFALENTNWVIVCLDSAYYASELDLYLDGSIGAANGAQAQFLQQQIAKGKKVIVMTHHNAIAEDGSSAENLWDEVIAAFPANSGPAYWYWGHVHAGVVYQPRPNGTASINCRCLGHGGLPWGEATELAANANVVWYESSSANDPDIPQRVLDGFVMLYLDGPNFQEVFYDENGGVAWP